MDLRQLEYFHASAREGSFSAAARCLHVTQSALSQGIKQLETRLGAPLFLRGRSLTLTEAGEALLPHASRLLEMASEAEEAVRTPGGPLEGTVRVGVLTSALTHVLPLVLADMVREHPGVRLEFEKTDPVRIEELVRRGEVHLGITPLAPSNPDLEGELLGAWPFVVAAHRDGRRRLPGLLRDHPLLVLGPWQEEILRGETDLFARFPRARILHGTNCVMVTRQLIAEGLGPGVIPSFALGRDLRRLETLDLAPLELYLVRRRRRVVRAAAEAFVAAMRARV